MRKQCLKIFSIILALSAFFFTLSIATNIFNAKATVEGFGMKSGAQVRMPIDDEEDMTGIRFTATLSSGAYETAVKNQSDPVYFGIELTANGVSKDIVYLVDDNTKITEAKQEIDFGSKSTYEYTASVLYNKETLKSDLIAEGMITENDESALNAYLRKAYATELTAKAFYRVGDGAKQYGSTETTRSIWGVAADAYIEDATEYAVLAEKYFTVGETKNVDIIFETGAVDYAFESTDKVYINTVLTTIADGKLAKSAYSNKNIGDTLKIAVIAQDGTLDVLNCTLVTNAKIIDTPAFYDAKEDKIYYMEGTTQKILAGSAQSSFNYIVDAEHSYPLAKYTGNTFVTNVNYKYADSVYFQEDIRGNDYADHRGGNLRYLQPKLKTDGDDVVVQIPYNAQKDKYTGVTVSIDTADGLYTFTNAVIISQMIDDATELDAVFNNADKDVDSRRTHVLRTAYVTQYGTITKGVYMLSQDIDASTGFTFDNSAWNFFEGVLDGRGHNVYNLDVSGTEDNPGNGLFSATSTYSVIQNIAFINVKASYGSVFQGNMFDRVSSVNTTIATYYMGDNVNHVDGNTGPGSIYYREQLVDETDTTTTIGELIKCGYRQGASALQGQGGYFQNVYVQINPETQRLMGVICRNMLNRPNTVRANNMVIEYLPTKLYDTTNGANDGALPYNYSYTEGKYGVIFGGAYENSSMSYNSQYETVKHKENYTKITYFTPGVNTSFANRPMQSQASLTFYRPQGIASFGNWFTHRVYVISPVGLVSCKTGSILGTNEQVTEGVNPYKFEAMLAHSHYDKPLADSEYANDYSKLERYDNYNAFKSAYGVGVTNQQLTSYMLDDGAEEKYWNFLEGYLKWNNV